MLRDLKPTDNVGGFDVRPGNFLLNGATTVSGGVNFTIHSVYAVECTLLLFRPYAKFPYARLRFPDSYKIGNTYSMLVFGLDEIDFEYAYSFDGPYEPEKGIIFDKKKYILDPYAKAVIGQSGWGKKQEHEGVYKARVVNSDYDWGNCTQPKLPFEELIIYELHVRGFTQDGSSGVKNKGTFAGIREKIPYLKELGINAVEMMPIFEFDEMGSYRNYDDRQLYDYWGYNTVCFFAPNTSYESDHEHHHEGRELKQLVRELHENGIEVILDVVFNHTAEGNEMGPYFSFKGIDNNIYYMLTPDGKYYNFSGCGNVLNCNQPIVQQFILDCLRYWVTEYRIDGFRFDLMGIHDITTMNDIRSALDGLYSDGSGKKILMYGEPWTGGSVAISDGCSQSRAGSLNSRVGMFCDSYRDAIKGSTDGSDKGFVQGNTDKAGTVANGVTGKGFSAQAPSQTIAYADAHDNLILWDKIVKSNGSSSWNSTSSSLKGQVKKVMGLLLTSQGIPFMTAGSEFCRTKQGDTNSYKSSDAINEIDWSRVKTYSDVAAYYKGLLEIRENYSPMKSSTFNTPSFQSTHGDVVAYTYSNTSQMSGQGLCSCKRKSNK